MPSVHKSSSRSYYKTTARKPDGLSRRKSTQWRFVINPAQYTGFLDGIRNGLAIATAAKLVDLNSRTVYKWLEKGEILSEEDDNWPPHSLAWQYSRFFRDFEKAAAQFEAIHAAKINNHHDWKASAYMLERKRPGEYSDKYQFQLEVRKEVTQVFGIIYRAASDECAVELASLLHLIPGLEFNESAVS